MTKQIMYKKKGRYFIDLNGRQYECYAEIHDSENNEYMYYVYTIYILKKQNETYSDNFIISLESNSGYKVHIVEQNEFDNIPAPPDVVGKHILKFGMIELLK